MKTKVFKLNRLSKTDIQSINQWLNSLRWVWNEGLRLLEELDTFTAVWAEIVEKNGKPKKSYHRAPCCPIPWQYRRIDKSQPWGEGNLAPYTYFARKRPYAQFCPLPQDYREPRLDQPTNFSIAKYFAHKRHSDKPWLQAIPAWFIRGTCQALADAWQRWKSGKGGKPRFKSARDTNDTLIHLDPKTFRVEAINHRDGLIRIPKLGVFRVKHLWEDWGDRPIKVLKVAKRPDGFYLQLTGQLDEEPLNPLPARECVLTAPEGVSPLLGTMDTGKAIAAYNPDPRLLHRKLLLQQQLSRQVYLSQNWHKTKRKLARIEKRLAEQAKNYNQKLSTFLIRTYTKVTLQSVGKRKVLRKPRRKERAKTINPIHFDPNGAEAIADYNQRIASQRTGQFVALIKQKGKSYNRHVLAE